MTNATNTHLTDDVLTVLSATEHERITVSDLVTTLRGSFRGGGPSVSLPRRWSFRGPYDLTQDLERLGFSVYYSTNERNQRAEFVALNEVHPYAPKAPEAPEGFVIVAKHVRCWSPKNSVVSRYTGNGRTCATKIEDAKIYKTRKGAEKAALKELTRFRREEKLNESVITVAAFLALQ